MIVVLAGRVGGGGGAGGGGGLAVNTCWHFVH